MCYELSQITRLDLENRTGNVSFTPDNINELTDSELEHLLTPLFKYSPKQLINLVRLIYRLLGYTLTNDTLLALVNDSKERLVAAIAGGGKTTFAQIFIGVFKVLHLNLYDENLHKFQILCLVYARANVSPMSVKQQSISSIINSSGILNKKDANNKIIVRVIENDVMTYTMHSWCRAWIDEYSVELKYSAKSQITEIEALSNLESAIAFWKSDHPGEIGIIDVRALMSLHNLARENFFTMDDIMSGVDKLHDPIIECGIQPTVIVEILKLYEKLKRQKKKMDFADELLIINKLFNTNPKFKERIHTMYKYVVADEIQDFTPLMMSILRNIVGNNTKLLAIGDEDQSIYAFRGADPNTVLNFTSTFPNSKIYTLMENRRCSTQVLDAARIVIESNATRFKKKLVSVRVGGKFSMVPYDNLPDQMSKLVSQLKQMPESIRNNTVVSFRDKIYCAPISKALYDAYIPYYVISGTNFIYTDIFSDFINVLDMINNPTLPQYFQYLYKVLNVKREDWMGHIKYDSDKNECTAFPKAVAYWDIDMSPFSRYRGFMDNLAWLTELSLSKSTKLLSSYYQRLLKLFKDNFWLNKSQYVPKQFSIEAESWLQDIFCKPITYREVIAYFADRTQYGVKFPNQYGVALDTFHSLKGLEFNTQIITFLDDDIFPNFNSIDVKPFKDGYKAELKEGETRLCYVAMTRARDTLTMMYNNSNPSYYINLLKGVESDKLSEKFDFDLRISSSRIY